MATVLKIILTSNSQTLKTNKMTNKMTNKIATTHKKLSSLSKKSYKNKPSVKSGKLVSSTENEIQQIIPHKLYTVQIEL